ncbi:hypothetical protein [Bradyrhizobium sp.]|uniref:hypothetical protein n=1 Tax=Bradyrhizobium sp. TaxID=376 RepID=UPI0025BA45D7|nr:hypothetical protein [Bradyrhizobium sp.]MCA3256285.1 hypothetical protein [Alphaproteobacteria bacterium]MCA3565980.1 hypothetical protein [Bradyrhizobium sp.]
MADEITDAATVAATIGINAALTVLRGLVDRGVIDLRSAQLMFDDVADRALRASRHTPAVHAGVSRTVDDGVRLLSA